MKSSTVYTEIEIALPPAKVRECLLKFKDWASWNSVMPTPLNLLSRLDPTKEATTILENTAQTLRWGITTGSRSVFHAVHIFQFRSIENGTRTKLVQVEAMVNPFKINTIAREL
jgi:hypothetical protein